MKIALVEAQINLERAQKWMDIVVNHAHRSEEFQVGDKEVL